MYVIMIIVITYLILFSESGDSNYISSNCDDNIVSRYKFCPLIVL